MSASRHRTAPARSGSPGRWAVAAGGTMLTLAALGFAPAGIAPRAARAADEAPPPPAAPGATSSAAPVATRAAAPAAPAAEHRLTLAQAIELALRGNEDIAVGREELIAARASVSGANGAYDPRLEIAGDWQRTTEPQNFSFSGAPGDRAALRVRSAGGTTTVRQLLPSGGTVTVGGRATRETTNSTLALLTPYYGTEVGIELRQPFLRGLTVDPARLAVRVARTERQGAAAALHRTVAQTSADVESAYWGLVAARRALEVRAESVRLAEEQLTETRARVESGAAPETELAQPRAELERRTGERLAAQEALSRAENALKVLILSGDSDALWAERLVPADDAELPVEPLNVTAEMEKALRVRPELAAGKAAVDRRRAESAFARDAVRPSLDAVLGYSRYGLAGTRNPADPDGLFPSGLGGDLGGSFRSLGEDDYDSFRAGLVIGFPIGNRGARASATAARSAERQAQADLTRLRKSIRAEVLDAAAALETAGQRIASARAGREAAEVQLSAERDRYAVGLSTNFLVLTRQNDLARARLDEISALTDYRIARAEMARATGTLLAERGIDPNGGIDR